MQPQQETEYETRQTDSPKALIGVVLYLLIEKWVTKTQQ